MERRSSRVSRRSFLQLGGGFVIGPGVVGAGRERAGSRSSSADTAGGDDVGATREPVDTAVIESSAVRELLSSLADERSMEWEYLNQDERIRAADRATTSRLLFEEDDTQAKGYREDTFDCEDFAWRVRMNLIERFGAYNVGVVLDYNDVEDHAYNFVVYPDGGHALFEPQEDVFLAPQDGTRYAFRDVLVIL
jgi:hypothetical protein